MTIDGRTAYRVRDVNPDCEVCEGTGRDVMFDTDCVECFRLHLTRSPRITTHLRPSPWQQFQSAFIDPWMERWLDEQQRRAAARQRFLYPWQDRRNR